MKHRHQRMTCGAAVLAAALALAPLATAASGRAADRTSSGVSPTGAETNARQSAARAAAESGANPPRGGDVQLASKADEDHLAEEHDDARVRGADGKELGSVRDFLVDMKAGTLCYAVVASGGWLGIGNHMHLVPVEALSADGEKNFKVNLSAAQWKSAPTIDEDQFEEGRVKVGAALDQRTAQAFHTRPMHPEGAPLLRVAKLRGQDLLSQGKNIGTIDGVLVQPGQRQALALIDPHDKIVGGEQTYLVPVTRLRIRGAGNGNVVTTLTPTDFRAANRRARGMPTGFPSAEQNPSADTRLIGEARAIRQALDRNPATSGEDVQVVPRSNRIVLQGKVPTEAARNALEKVVAQAAPQALITDEVKTLDR